MILLEGEKKNIGRRKNLDVNFLIKDLISYW